MCAGLYIGGWGWLAVICGILLLMLACISRSDGFLLFGPFATVEARRLTRQDKVHLRRVMLLLGVGFLVFLCFAINEGAFVVDSAAGRYRLQKSAELLTTLLGVVLPTTVALLTIVSVSGVIADERSTKRWEVLLATDLRPREIVYGKVITRAVSVLILASAVLPVMLMLGQIGLLPYAAILPGAAFLAATILALGGLAVRFSLTRSASAAASLTIFWAGFYLAATSILCSILRPSGFTVWDSPFGYNILAILNAANPYTTIRFVFDWGSPTTEELLAGLFRAVRRYAAGAIAVFLWGTLSACRDLRDSANIERRTLAQRLGALTGRLLRLFGLLKRPRRPVSQRVIDRVPVTDEPLEWWIINHYATGRRWLTDALTIRMVFSWFVGSLGLFLGCWLIWHFCPTLGLRRTSILGILGDGIVGLAVLIGLFSFLAAVIRAARSLAEQRVADTFETLRLTALSASDIVRQVHSGSLAGYRRLLPRLTALLAAAAVTGYVQWQPTVFYLVLAWLIPPAFLSWVVLMTCRRATPGEAVRIALVGGGGAHIVTALGVIVPAILLWQLAYYTLIGGHRIPLISEFFWWDWLIDPKVTDRLGYSAAYRSVGWIKFGRLVWPLGPIVGVGLLAIIVTLYVRLSRLALRAASFRLARDWYALQGD